MKNCFIFVKQQTLTKQNTLNFNIEQNEVEREKWA